MEVFCDGFDTSGYLDTSASGRDPELAVQQKLGLWTKRWNRSDSGHRSDPVIVKGHLELTISAARASV